MPQSSEHKNKGDGRIQFNSIHSRYAHLGIYTKVKEERTERLRSTRRSGRPPTIEWGWGRVREGHVAPQRDGRRLLADTTGCVHFPLRGSVYVT